MVDKNQLKIAHPVDLEDDDPFAELTRIMGFDPRQPVKPVAAPAPQAKAAAEADDEATDDDFSIDLEKELMGEFGADEEAVDPVPAIEPEAFAEADPQFFSESQPVDPVDHVAAAIEDDVQDAADLDFDFTDDLDEVVAASVNEAVEPEDRAFPEDTDEPEFAAVEAQPADEMDFDLELADDFDERASASAAEDFAEGEELVDEATADPEAGAVELQPVSVTQDDVDPVAQFDAALAEIDMSFAPSVDDRAAGVEVEDDRPVEAVSDDGALEAEADAELEDDAALGMALLDEDDLRFEDHDPQRDEDVDDLPERAAADPQEGEAQAAFDTEFDLALDHLDLADESEATAAEVAPAPEFAADAAPVPSLDEPEAAAEPEFSLEDELNALLGNSLAASRPAAGFDAKPEHFSTPFQHVDAAPEAADEVWNIDDEDVLAAAGTDPAEDDATYVEQNSFDADAEFDSRAEFVDETVEHAAEAEAEAEPVDDDLPGFDHDAFSAAIAIGLDSAHEDIAAESADDLAVEETSEPAVAATGSRQDPLDIIAALTAKYAASVEAGARDRDEAFAAAASPASHASAAPAQDDFEFPATAFNEAPDVETVDVADRPVALADDLDIPEIAYEEELPPVSAYDDLDTEFASLLNDMNAGDATQQQHTAQGGPAEGEDLDGGRRNAPAYDYAMGAAAVAAAGAAAATGSTARPASMAASHDPVREGQFELDADNLPGSRPVQAAPQGINEFDYDPDFDEDMSIPAFASQERARPPRRGMLIAAIVGGVALVGGVGAFALSFGDRTGAAAPVIVKADDGPIKIKPENPGGATVPNQESKVYDTVAGAGATPEPQQEKLVTTAEEPIDMTPPVPEDEVAEAAADPVSEETVAEPTAATASAKGEDRIEQILQENETDTDTRVAAIAPRKVRTMIVKPDGTLVPREDPAPAETAAAPAAETAAEAVKAGATTDMPATTSGVPVEEMPTGEDPVIGEAPAPVKQKATAAAKPKAVEPAAPKVAAEAEAKVASASAPAPLAPGAGTQSSTMPDVVPIAPQRPAEQPVDVVGEVKPDKVAVVSAAPTTVSGAWSMQIASQPSEAAAQSSYQDLARRYGSVLNGRDVNIVKAEIAGKGTFWRVRVPAGSRNEAISLCESYKSVGGNCFVSR